jgi:hypothetical protein
VIYNAPIIATGEGPFDVTTHANTHDRTLGIDTEEMTTDHLFVRGFANGRSIAYLSFDSSDAFTATIERSTFVPALADLQFANGGDGPSRDDRSDSARASIFTFVNAKVGLETAPPDTGATQGEGRSQGCVTRRTGVGRGPGERRPRGGTYAGCFRFTLSEAEAFGSKIQPRHNGWVGRVHPR